MENSSIIKQAKSDIFKELHPIINFYIKKGATPAALKKYYKNSKRLNDLQEDIKNKGINLVKDEDEYKKLVKEILNDLLDDFIAKQKDEEYKNKEKSMKHIKEFNSFSENFMNVFLGISGAFFFYKFMKELFKTLKRKKYSKMAPSEIQEYEKQKKDSREYGLLSSYIREFLKEGGKIKFSENYLYYIFELDELSIKIDKNNNTIFWNYITSDFKGGKRWKIGKRTEFSDIDYEQFDYIKPIPISKEDIEYLVNSIKEETNENTDIK